VLISKRSKWCWYQRGLTLSLSPSLSTPLAMSPLISTPFATLREGCWYQRGHSKMCW
jgi:hypothetical protein